MKFGSSENSGESSPNFEEEVFVVAESIGHSLDDLDLVVDAFELACVERPLGVGDDARLSLVKILSAVDNYLGGNRCSRTHTIIVPLHVGNLTTNVGR